MVVALILTLTTACSGTDRNYQIPDDLCGIPVNSERMAPFLPGGEKLFQRDWTENASSGGISCTLGVDDEDQLNFTGSWADRIAVDTRVAIDQGTPLLGGEYYTIPKNATAYFPCSNPKVRLGAPRSKDGKPRTVPATFYIVEVESLHHPEDEAESEKAMKRFIVPFAKAVKKKLPCR